MPTHKHIIRTLAQAGLTAGLFLVPAAAMAQGMTFSSDVQTGIASLTVMVVAALNLLTWVFFIFLTILLDPEFIFNTQNGNGFETVLNNIWMLARDLMNIGFALALIGAAIYTIVTAKKDFVASHLKTFVLAVILVNFSWFIPRVIIDVGNVAASAIYGVPSLLQTQGVAEQCRFTTGSDLRPLVSCEEVPPAAEGGVTRYNCQCAMLADAVFFTEEANAEKLDGEGWQCVLGKTMCLKFVNLDVNTVAGHSAVLNGLIVNHARLQGLAGVSPEEKGGSEVGAMIQFVLRQVIVIVIHVALLFPLAAMAIAFAIRIPVLWLTIAFMPFAMLKFVLPGNYGEWPQKIWDNFLKAAFLPALVAVPLSVGFILVNAGAQMINAAPVLTRIGGVGFRITDGVSDLFELLWLGLTLGVLYAGVFMVLEKVGGFAAKAAGVIQGIGNNLGQIAIKAPLSMPIIPGPGGGINLLSIPSKLRSINAGLSTDSGGFKSVWDNAMKTPAGGGAFEASGAAHFLADNTSKLNDLNGKIADLTAALNANPKDTAALDKFQAEINNLGIKFNIDKNDPLKSLNTLKTAMESNGKIDSGALADFVNNLQKFEETLKNNSAPPPNNQPPNNNPPAGNP